jgi:hypothetical protein
LGQTGRCGRYQGAYGTTKGAKEEIAKPIDMAITCFERRQIKSNQLFETLEEWNHYLER